MGEFLFMRDLDARATKLFQGPVRRERKRKQRGVKLNSIFARRCRLESLEQRRLLTAITWSGAGDGTTFTSAANWIGGVAPGPNDHAIIGASSTTIGLSGDISVESIVSGAPLDVTSGSLTVDSGASQANAGLTVASGAALYATGGGTSFEATGATVIDGASVFAQDGGSLTLPGLTSYTTSSTTALSVDGAGSMLNLDALTSIVVQGGAELDLSATDGGNLDLSGLTNTSLQGLGGANVTDTGGSAIQLNSSFTVLTGINLTLDGTGTIATGQWTSFTNGSVTITGGSYTLPKLTDIDESSLFVTGGASLTLPKLTSYSDQSFLEFSVDGAGSVLNLSAMTSITQQIGGGDLTATDGGDLNLSELTNSILNGVNITDTGGTRSSSTAI
jgi:fibronectin-binding autotransporter adhesin